MNDNFIPFDEISNRTISVLETLKMPSKKIGSIYLVRDFFGKVRISVSDTIEGNKSCQSALQRFANSLYETLGAHGYPPEDAVLFMNLDMLKALGDAAREIRPNVYWIDRLLTGRDWWTVGDLKLACSVKRYTLYSVKGGVGRSTTTAVLARHLARNGKRVMVVDLDLESPGLSSAMLDTREQPKFGVTDWFVEDLVGHGEQVIDEMIASPSWAREFEGEVYVIPAHGDDPGEYLAKLGRVYMDDTATPWTKRLEGLLQRLEQQCKPTVVLLESRSGLHDIAAATVTDINAQVLLFATDSASTWDDYEIIFRHWRDHELATRIRTRLSIVSALTPETETEHYLEGFRERSWELFQEYLYDEVGSPVDSYNNDVPGNLKDDQFSFDLWNEDGTSQSTHDSLDARSCRRNIVAQSGADDRRAGIYTISEAIRYPQRRRDLVTGEIDVEMARSALANLPKGVSYGRTLPVKHVYLPQSHLKALDPNALIVSGMRGAGKTFWWSALQQKEVHQLIRESATQSTLGENIKVQTGFGVKSEY